MRSRRGVIGILVATIALASCGGTSTIAASESTVAPDYATSDIATSTVTAPSTGPSTGELPAATLDAALTAPRESDPNVPVDEYVARAVEGR